VKAGMMQERRTHTESQLYHHHFKQVFPDEVERDRHCLFPVSIVYLYYDIIIDGGSMQTVTISPKFQIVIPRPVRESMRLKPGQRVQVVEYGKRIELIPVSDISSMRGFVSGIDTAIDRNEDRV
jgi:AbrB family looped-hinge helix DNA binding protein